ncbi:RNA 3'-terminal phosphate cyclase/enolpyruvate transferase, partial [Baffinella frigidus]
MSHNEITGRSNFREKIFLSIYSKKKIRIKNLKNSGIKKFEINLLCLVDKIAPESYFFLNESGTILDFCPGNLIGGKIFHKTDTFRSLTYYLEFLCYITLISKNWIELKLTGLRSINADLSLESFLYSTIPMYRKFGGRDIRIKIWTEKLSKKKNTNAIFFFPGKTTLNCFNIEFPGELKSLRILISSPLCNNINQEKIKLVISKKFSIKNLDYKVYSFDISNKNIFFQTITIISQTSRGHLISADFTSVKYRKTIFWLDILTNLLGYMKIQVDSKSFLDIRLQTFFLLKLLV